MATENDSKPRMIENIAEKKVLSWKNANTDVKPLKQELLSLICNKTTHSAKLMRLYTEVLLLSSDLEEGYASFDTYCSLQSLSLMKARSGARSLPDSLEHGTVPIFILMLATLEHQGLHSEPRIIKLGEQLNEILAQCPEKDSEEVINQVAPLHARIALTRMIASQDDEEYEKESSEASSWFARVSHVSNADADTLYAKGLFNALTRGPSQAFPAVKAALQKSPDHVRAFLLLVQLLSAEQQLEDALKIISVYLSRKKSATSIIDKIALIRLKKTHIALLEVLKGPEEALSELTEFIALVNMLFAIEGHGSKENANGRANGHATTTQAKPARRIFSFKSKHTNESLASNITTPSSVRASSKQIAETDSRIIAFSWFWIAQQYAKVKLDNEAREALKEGRSYLRSNEDLHGSAQIQAVLGQIEQEHSPEKALKHYLHALDIVPLHIPSLIGAVLILTADASKNPINLNNELALTLTGSLGSVCKSTPGRFVPEAWFTRGLLYEKLGVKAEARSMFWKALELEERRGLTGYITSAHAPFS